MLEVSISKKAVIEYELHRDIPPVRADSSQIGQVILNLITNASDALEGESGVISVSTGSHYCDLEYLEEIRLGRELRPGDYTYVEVSDTGCGMSEKTKRRLFDPFFTTKLTGRGLGMAAVLGIIRGHEGAIEIDSTEGEGTSIKVLLPASEKTHATETAARVPESAVAGEGTALLADDEEAIRSLGRRMLERLGYRVLLAVDGRNAVELFNDHHEEVSVVLLDLTMPHMDGMEALRAMRRIREDVPVILTSGYDEEDVTHDIAERGPAAFIQKPYGAQELAAKLADLFKA